MVPDHLNRVLLKFLGRLRRPGAGILLATTSTLVLVLSLVGFTAEKSTEQASRKPSLFDLLDDLCGHGVLRHGEKRVDPVYEYCAPLPSPLTLSAAYWLMCEVCWCR